MLLFPRFGVVDQHSRQKISWRMNFKPKSASTCPCSEQLGRMAYLLSSYCGKDKREPGYFGKPLYCPLDIHRDMFEFATIPGSKLLNVVILADFIFLSHEKASFYELSRANGNCTERQLGNSCVTITLDGKNRINHFLYLCLLHFLPAKVVCGNKLQFSSTQSRLAISPTEAMRNPIWGRSSTSIYEYG